MKITRVLFWWCLTAASFAYLIGVSTHALSASTSISCRLTGQAEQQQPPPAGDQFEEGPVLARLPSAHLAPVRYVF